MIHPELEIKHTTLQLKIENAKKVAFKIDWYKLSSPSD
jgi:hypothetical protein